MTGQAIQTPLPATETRGGEAPDWDAVQPGELLPDGPAREMIERGAQDPDAAGRRVQLRRSGISPLPQVCSHPDCGGD